MRPIFRIFADSKDVTDAVKDRLLDMSVSDEAGITSDTLSLTIDDRPTPGGAVAALPRIETKLAVSMGYLETGLTDMGLYIVDSMTISAPPATLKVSAKAADMTGPFRSPKTRSWDQTTLGGIASTIAGEHGYTPKLDAQLGSIAIPHVDQHAESDMALLTRLAELYDATAKPANGFLVLAKQGAASSATGRALSVTVRAHEISTWDYQQESRSPGGATAEGEGESGGYRAKWWDHHTGWHYVTTGATPYEDLKIAFDSEAKALAAVNAKYNKGKRREKRLSLSLPGNPALAAETRLILPDLRPGLPTDWRIVKAEHNLSAQGYTTRVECELFL